MPATGSLDWELLVLDCGKVRGTKHETDRCVRNRDGASEERKHKDTSQAKARFRSVFGDADTLSLCSRRVRGCVHSLKHFLLHGFFENRRCQDVVALGLCAFCSPTAPWRSHRACGRGLGQGSFDIATTTRATKNPCVLSPGFLQDAAQRSKKSLSFPNQFAPLNAQDMGPIPDERHWIL